MKSIRTIISQKKKYYKGTEHYNPYWRQEFRYWRRTYLELMDLNGYSISVANYYLQVLEKREKQHKRIKKAELLDKYWSNFEIEASTQSVTVDNFNYSSPWSSQIGTYKGVPIYFNQDKRVYYLPNGFEFTPESIQSGLDNKFGEMDMYTQMAEIIENQMDTSVAL